MTYVAQKPCRFAGVEFKIGEQVPDELIAPGASKSLVKMGVVAMQNEMLGEDKKMSGPQYITIVTHTEEGNMPLYIDEKSMQDIFDVIMGTAADAEQIISQIENDNALILLHMADSRKAVKAAAEERAKALQAPDSNTEGKESEGEN